MSTAKLLEVRIVIHSIGVYGGFLYFFHVSPYNLQLFTFQSPPQRHANSPAVSGLSQRLTGM